MKRCSLLVALLVLVSISLASGAAWALELPELAAQTKPSVVHLKVLDSSDREVASGTGFFVSATRVVTNEHVVANLSVAVENLSASESRVRDTDMAEEMVAFTRNQIMVQAGTAMLAQANQVPQSILALLR